MKFSKLATFKSIVLLQNKEGLLPLSKSIKTIAVVGPFANETSVLRGNYNGDAANPITFLNGIKNFLGNNISVITNDYINFPDKDYLSEANEKDSIALLVKNCASSDVVIFCGGLSPGVEGEEGSIEKKGFFHGDRTSLDSGS